MELAETTSIPKPAGRNQSPGELQHLLGSLSVEEFFAGYWNQKAHCEAGHAEKFAGLFDKAAFDHGLSQCADLKIGYTDERGWPAHRKIEPAEVPEMLRAGKTVCAAGIDSGNAKLKEFLIRVRQPFSLLGRFFFNSYLSPDGAGFGLHLDDHPVFILQIEGRKRWWYSPEPVLKNVLTNISFPASRNELKLPWVTVTRPAEAKLREVVLSPGDVLYLPKGSWHRAQAIGGSLALTLAMESASALELVQHALGPHLNKVELRDRLPAFERESFNKEMPAALEEICGTALHDLRALLSTMTPADLYQLWKQSEKTQ